MGGAGFGPVAWVQDAIRMAFQTLLRVWRPRESVLRTPLEQESDLILIAKDPVRALLEYPRQRPIGRDQRELPAIPGVHLLPVVAARTYRKIFLQDAETVIIASAVDEHTPVRVELVIEIPAPFIGAQDSGAFTSGAVEQTGVPGEEFRGKFRRKINRPLHSPGAGYQKDEERWRPDAGPSGRRSHIVH